MTDSDGRLSETPQARLARKLNLLLDLFEAQGYSPSTDPQISRDMEDQGRPCPAAPRDAIGSCGCRPVGP